MQNENICLLFSLLLWFSSCSNKKKAYICITEERRFTYSPAVTWLRYAVLVMCVDIKNYWIDYSRCVRHMNCIDSCDYNAMNYKPSIGKKRDQIKGEKAEQSVAVVEDNDFTRRNFVSLTALMAVSSVAKAQRSRSLHYVVIQVESLKTVRVTQK